MKIVTAAEMREIDRRTTEEFGVPSLTLMENAGTRVAEFCLREYPQAKTVGVICGKGNNGGDGLVAARKLHEAGRDVRVLLLADPAEVRGDAAAILQKLPVKPLVLRSLAEVNDACVELYTRDLLIDAVLGTGFKPPASELYEWAMEYFWEVFAPVVSVDLPSGVLADETNEEESERLARAGRDLTLPSARSSAVVTFTAPRPAHVFQEMTSGAIVVEEIGSPEEAIRSQLRLETITRRDLVWLRAGRSAESHKGDYGHVLVIGGSRGKAGAAAMAGMGALRAGAGLCTVATAAGVQALVSSFAPELMTEGLAETEEGAISLRALEYGRMEEILKGKSVLAVGPGISQHGEAAELARTLVREAKLPVVLDADGLNAFAGHTEELDGSARQLVITPHPGEMARLTGLSTAEIQAHRIDTAREFAQRHNCVVVLKGRRTLVAEPRGTVWVNMTGNPGMATGGSGDLLTGIIAGLIAQYPKRNVSPVLAGVYVHGLAGDLACAQLGEQAMLATDIIENLGKAFVALEQDRRLNTLRDPLPQPFWRREDSS
jgi:hydroxyethylthiazole kinase-like uncharacterized protein yjeF